MSFIEELFHGYIEPNLKRSYDSVEYSMAIDKLCHYEEKLKELLRNEELKLFNKAVAASSEIAAIQDASNFKIGFSLGVQMMIDVLSVDREKLFVDLF